MSERVATRFQMAVFDVAGTTVIDGDAVLDCLSAAMAERVAVSPQEVRDVMGLPKPIAIRLLLSRATTLHGLGLDVAVQDVHERFRVAMIERYRQAGSIAPAEGALDVFAALRRSGVRVVLDTGFSRDILDTVLTTLGWAGGRVIDSSIASDEVERGRPHADLIFRAMTLAGVADPHAVAKIGDTPSDVDEGLAAGCGLIVGVTYGTHTRRQLERPGVEVIDRLPDLLSLMGVEAA